MSVVYVKSVDSLGVNPAIANCLPVIFPESILWYHACYSQGLGTPEEEEEEGGD